MTDPRTELDERFRRLVHRLAPEVDVDAVAGDAALQDELDLDSMDLLSLYTAVHEETGVDIPEDDYSQVATLDGLVAYVAERMQRSPS